MSRVKTISLALAGMAAFASPIAAQDAQTPDTDVWYRLVTMYNGTDARLGRCVQYFPEGSAHSDMIWSAAPVEATDAAYDYQFWRFEPSPDDPKVFALVCKAAPDGYLSIDPTAFSVDGRWKYVSTSDSSTPDDKYGFKLGALKAGVDSETGEVYTDIYTDADEEGLYRYMNCAGADQDYAINVSRATVAYDTNEWVFRLSPRKPVSGLEGVAADMSQSETGQSAVYDLYGRKVAHPGHGIYVVDGRKVVY